ncbi:hypothetical protein BTA51_22730 [Hahella sp. CCB-MM4]|uniref:lipase secretion chaperone n=1 Tax=Hahella sp. (strain CCB-MM4) TaxID=1926491 RepID=UPI000B9C5BF0|nr:lipase secretion chaperone [Hahella sp. CCB-MM4]OZG71187.1 hypothetical protein BTA51_22730 [Hahella sp. CCB-MM4]
MRSSEVHHNLMLTAVIGLIGVGVVAILMLNTFISPDAAGTGPVIEAEAADNSGSVVGAIAVQHAQVNASSQATGKEVQELPVPRILKGTRPPEGLVVDPQGHLLVTFEFRELMDYFTQLIGVEGVPHEMALALAQQHFRHELSEPALSEALEILDRYWQYTESVNGAQNLPEIKEAKANFDGHYAMDAVASVEKFREERSNIQQALFTPEEIDAFFADEQRYDRFMLEQIRISQSDLDDDQRKVLQANNQQTLSTEQLHARQQTQIIERYKNLVKEEQLQPGMGNWYQEVSQEMGNDVAEKLLQVEREKQNWAEKKAAYQSRKDQLLGAGLSEQDLNQQLDMLMVADLGFSEFELRRMQAIEGRLPN